MLLIDKLNFTWSTRYISQYSKLKTYRRTHGHYRTAGIISSSILKKSMDTYRFSIERHEIFCSNVSSGEATVLRRKRGLSKSFGGGGKSQTSKQKKSKTTFQFFLGISNLIKQTSWLIGLNLLLPQAFLFWSDLRDLPHYI